MKQLYTQSEWDNAKCYDLLKFECTQCHQEFTKTKSYITQYLKGKQGWGSLDYCGPKCKGISNLIHYKCKECGKECSRKPSAYKLSKNHFCSISCSSKYTNRNQPIGHNRSKLEEWIETQLINLYPNLQFQFNQRDTINSELDIYIPSLQLAFELNGVFHYEPIWGTDKLNRIQNNDKRKYQACLEKGIELCIIDTSSHTSGQYLNPKKAQGYLDIIKKVIGIKKSIIDGTYVGENI